MTRKRMTNKELHLIHALFDKGFKPREVEEITNRSYSTIHKAKQCKTLAEYKKLTTKLDEEYQARKKIRDAKKFKAEAVKAICLDSSEAEKAENKVMDKAQEVAFNDALMVELKRHTELISKIENRMVRLTDVISSLKSNRKKFF